MTSQAAINHILQHIQVNIDCIEEANEALFVIHKLVDKSTPKKPILEGQDEQDYILCPCCKNIVGAVDDYFGENKLNKFCRNCGQALDWEGTKNTLDIFLEAIINTSNTKTPDTSIQNEKKTQQEYHCEDCVHYDDKHMSCLSDDCPQSKWYMCYPCDEACENFEF